MATGPEHHAQDLAPLHVLQVARLPTQPQDHTPWLIQDLWADQAVGLIGGAPKCCKTFLALEMALAVASGSPCLGRFPVPDPGPVLLFAAEDAPLQIRARLAALANARGVDFDALPVFLILADQLRLDLPCDHSRLITAVENLRPRLLILDPFVRLHRLDENSAMEVSALLADLRILQRRFALAVTIVHHTRKANGEASGQALRGSGDLHAWGDSNLYLRRSQDHFILAVEHRAAPTPQPFALALSGQDPHLQLTGTPPAATEHDLGSKVLEALQCHDPLTQQQLRQALRVRNQSLTAALRDLLAQNKISRLDGGWTLTP